MAKVEPKEPLIKAAYALNGDSPAQRIKKAPIMKATPIERIGSNAINQTGVLVLVLILINTVRFHFTTHHKTHFINTNFIRVKGS